jgi:hypothetical protein
MLFLPFQEYVEKSKVHEYYSQELRDLVTRCLTVDQLKRMQIRNLRTAVQAGLDKYVRDNGNLAGKAATDLGENPHLLPDIWEDGFERGQMAKTRAKHRKAERRWETTAEKRARRDRGEDSEEEARLERAKLEQKERGTTGNGTARNRAAGTRTTRKTTEGETTGKCTFAIWGRRSIALRQWGTD